ncbi:UDP-2,3-diacylglucosamine hydrolase [biofilm metagenome]
MKEEILFISDLHLAWEKPEITKRFIQFLETRAVQAKALYILGDLFDAWVGDDDFTPPGNTVRAKLKQLSQSGVRVFLQLGNRDFLIGQSFCDDAGVVPLGDYTVIDLFGEPTLLTHGDLLCTDDHAYQAFRVKSRSDEWQSNVLSKPLFVRLLAARWYRLRSFFHKQQKTQDIMDVNQETVINTMTRYDCSRLIHGHTHRPAIHTLSIKGKAAQRFVLADWTPAKGEVLVWDEIGYHVETF